MIDFIGKPYYDFQDLVHLVKFLRAPQGCPWDSTQTHQSIRRNFIEEVYEACEAIDRDDPEHLREELGDVLLHVVFHADIEDDAGRFTIDDVCDSVVKKMVSRHPDLFGGEKGLSWDEIKRRERGQTSAFEELSSVARSLPALWRAEKLQSKARKAGLMAAEDPVNALKTAVRHIEHSENKEAALGELLFSAVNAAGVWGIDPEAALTARSDAFLRDVQTGQITNFAQEADREGEKYHEQD